MYQIISLYKIAELDNWENGITESTAHARIDLKWRNSDLKGLISDVSEFVGDKEPAINPCGDEASRIDWQVYENGEGYPATEREMDQFKEGKIDLYLCTYTAHVEQVTKPDLEKLLK
jgi:hypothetical protein